LNGIQEVDGSIPFGSTISRRRRIYPELLILIALVALAVPGWIAMSRNPPLRNAVILDAADAHVRPAPDERVNLAQLKYGTSLSASSTLSLANSDVAWLVDGQLEKPFPRWTSSADDDPWVTVHFARPSAIEEIKVIAAPVTEPRQRPINAMLARCDDGQPVALTRIDGRRFGAQFEKALCSSITLKMGHLDDHHAVLSLLEVMIYGTQPENAAQP
jgi:hypothetical protein